MATQVIKNRRHLHEVVHLTRDCEIGKAGERAVVIALSDRYMTLLFANRARDVREVNTGADYAFVETMNARQES